MNNSHVDVVTFQQISSRKGNVTIEFMTLRAITFITSLISTVIFLHLKHKNPIYKFLCMMSASDALNYFLIFFLGSYSTLMFYLDPECTSLHCLFYAHVSIWINEYITTCLAVFSIVLECYLTLQRIFVLSETRAKSSNKMINSGWIGVAILLIIVILHVPLFWLFEVKMIPFLKNDHRIIRNHPSVNFTYGYDVIKTPFGYSIWGELVVKILSLMRILLVTVVLLALNICAIVCFNRFFIRKESLTITKKNVPRNSRTPSQEENRRSMKRRREGKSVTKMLIIVSFMYILGNLPHSAHFIYRMIVGRRVRFVLRISQIALNFCISIKLVIYYLYNPPYRQCFNSAVVSMCPRCFRRDSSIPLTSSSS